MKVTLREQKMKNGQLSLFLDYYPPLVRPDTGRKTRREFLQLYLYAKPKTDLERNHNRETRGLAENVRARRLIEIQANNYGFLAKSYKAASFLDYFLEVAAKHKTSKSTEYTWHNSFVHLKDFCQGSLAFGQISKEFIEDFRQYLLTCPSRRSKARTLSPNTAAAYFQCFCGVVTTAHKAKRLNEDFTAEVKPIKAVEAAREYLTIDELQRLSATPANIPDALRRAALFSTLTGMRFSDITGLLWKNVQRSKADGYFVSFKIKKTGENLTLPISDEAAELLGEPAQPNEKVFANLDYGAMTSVHLSRWTLAAGITKKITFHCFRHTFATAQLTLGSDLYTVSKMLGHKSIQKTQIYAKIIDQKKREAAGKIKLK